jgi:NAD(P)-dependent dehydrogenase (short-subunit alcohol dehydrogenase family)
MPDVVHGFRRTILVASWVGIPQGPQYSASKHGVLGLMRALDRIVTADNIRIAAIHPWFAGMYSSLPSHPFGRADPLLPLRRHRYAWAPDEVAGCRHPEDARAAYRGRHLPRGDGPGPRDERLPVGAAGRWTRDPRREGGASRGRVRDAQ